MQTSRTASVALRLIVVSALSATTLSGCLSVTRPFLGSSAIFVAPVSGTPTDVANYYIDRIKASAANIRACADETGAEPGSPLARARSRADVLETHVASFSPTAIPVLELYEMAEELERLYRENCTVEVISGADINSTLYENSSDGI